MAAKIRKNDLAEVVRKRMSDGKALAERSARRAEEDLEPLIPGNKGKQDRVIQVFPAEGKALVEGINLKTRHMRRGQQGSASGIEAIEALISLSKVALVDPETKKHVRTDFREDTVERGSRTRTVRVRAAHGGMKRGVEQDKEIWAWPRV